METLRVLHVDGLDIRVELFLGSLLVVTLTGNSDSESVRNALDAAFPNLLVELGVEADIDRALQDILGQLQSGDTRARFLPRMGGIDVSYH